MDQQKRSTMRAVVWEGKPYQVAVRDWPKPTIQMPEDAIIRITTAGLCGSGLHTYHGYIGGDDVPWTLGHEAIGVVVEVGSATEEFKVGDRVLVPAGPGDGHYETESTAMPGFVGYGFGAMAGNLGGTQGEFRSHLSIPYMILLLTA
jgi:threonine dehydrogenase-like Zn-dependent dehydrogenase